MKCSKFLLERGALAALVLPVVLLVQASPVAAQLAGLTPAQHALYREAIESFRSHHYPGAYGRFAALADAGHVPSARIALLMAQEGSVLFGSDWTATPLQQQRWSALQINGLRSRLLPLDHDNGD